MKLLTHNFLSSRFLKGAKEGYPLILVCNDKREVNSEFDEDLTRNLLANKLDYKALLTAANAIGEGSKLPAELPSEAEWTEEFLEEIHRIVYTIDIVDGVLKCPDTGREFPIKDGIPNMLCDETELP